MELFLKQSLSIVVDELVVLSKIACKWSNQKFSLVTFLGLCYNANSSITKFK